MLLKLKQQVKLSRCFATRYNNDSTEGCFLFRYSHTNIHLKDNRRKFWEFSWDEMAKYDLPTVVDFVTLNTGVDKIHYVGHSQGTLIAFTGFSQNKDLASKIEHFYALAPILSVGDNEGN